jgi:hypothetical protein
MRTEREMNLESLVKSQNDQITAYKKQNREQYLEIKQLKKQLELTAVVQAKPEVCQCPEDDDNVYLNKLEWHCCYCKKPVRQTSC